VTNQINNSSNLHYFELKNSRRKYSPAPNSRHFPSPKPTTTIHFQERKTFSARSHRSNHSDEVAPIITSAENESQMYEEHDPYWDLRNSHYSRKSLTPFSFSSSHYSHEQQQKQALTQSTDSRKNSGRSKKGNTPIQTPPATPLEQYLVRSKEKLQNIIRSSSSRGNHCSPIFPSTIQSKSSHSRLQCTQNDRNLAMEPEELNVSPENLRFEDPEVLQSSRSIFPREDQDENIVKGKEEVELQHDVTPNELMEDIIEILSQIDATISAEDFSLPPSVSSTRKRTQKENVQPLESCKESPLPQIIPVIHDSYLSSAATTISSHSSSARTTASSSPSARPGHNNKNNNKSIGSASNCKNLKAHWISETKNNNSSNHYTVRELHEINEIIELLSHLTDDHDEHGNLNYILPLSPINVSNHHPYEERLPFSSVQRPQNTHSNSKLFHSHQSHCSSLTNDLSLDQRLLSLFSQPQKEVTSPCQVSLHDYYFSGEKKQKRVSPMKQQFLNHLLKPAEWSNLKNRENTKTSEHKSLLSQDQFNDKTNTSSQNLVQSPSHSLSSSGVPKYTQSQTSFSSHRSRRPQTPLEYFRKAFADRTVVENTSAAAEEEKENDDGDAKEYDQLGENDAPASSSSSSYPRSDIQFPIRTSSGTSYYVNLNDDNDENGTDQISLKNDKTTSLFRWFRVLLWCVSLGLLIGVIGVFQTRLNHFYTKETVVIVPNVVSLRYDSIIAESFVATNAMTTKPLTVVKKMGSPAQSHYSYEDLLLEALSSQDFCLLTTFPSKFNETKALTSEVKINEFQLSKEEETEDEPFPVLESTTFSTVELETAKSEESKNPFLEEQQFTLRKKFQIRDRFTGFPSSSQRVVPALLSRDPFSMIQPKDNSF
jgi:hypothetical protein